MQPVASGAATHDEAVHLLSYDEIDLLLQHIDRVPAAEQHALLQSLHHAMEMRRVHEAGESLIGFARYIWPEFRQGPHHKYIARLYDRAVDKESVYATVSIAPRMGKSQLLSWLGPAYFLGKRPTEPIILATHTEDLSTDFGRKIRNTIKSPEYTRIFPEVEIAKDSKASGKFNTTLGGGLLCVGVGTSLAGYGGRIIIADDLVSEKTALTANRDTWEKIWTWVQTGPVQRTQPGNSSIIVVGTRWHAADPIGKIQKQMGEDPAFPRFTVTEFPAILPSGSALWPEFWPVKKLEEKKASMAPYMWAAQYMQDPTAEGANIIHRDSWRVWDENEPPECDFVVAALDTAHGTTKVNDYSALVVLGRFYVSGGDTPKQCNPKDKDARPAFIVLDCVKQRIDFPALKRLVLEKRKQHEWDALVVEKTAAGAPLIAELAHMGIYCQPFTPTRATGDKVARTQAVADVWHSRTMWRPTYRWAQELAEDMHQFPSGEHDDTHDACIMAVAYLRNANLIHLTSDTPDEPSSTSGTENAFTGAGDTTLFY